MYRAHMLQVVQCVPGRTSSDEAGPGHCDAVMGMDAHPTLPMFVSGGNDKTLRVWRMP